jgi:type I restriction enzyme S subunit
VNTWTKTTVGAAFATATGITPPKNNADFYGDFMPFVKPPELRDTPFDSALDGLSELGVNVARTLPVKSILISCIGNLGKIGLNTIPVAFNQQINAILPDEKKAIPEFMFFQSLSPQFREQLESLASGTTVAIVNKSKFNGVEIVLPPLPEQKRIVGILDKAFDGIATAKANAEKNLQNARALFESHLQTVFTQRGKGWEEKTLEIVCNKITDGTHHSPQTQFTERAPGRFPYITSKNIRNNHMDLSNVAYIEKAFHDEVYARCKPCVGDVLLTKDGANTGNVTLNTLNEPFSLLSSVCLIKTNPNMLRPAFLCYYLQSSTGLSSIIGQMTGAAIKRIVLKDIKKATIPFPPIKEQDKILGELNSLLVYTQCLAGLFERKLAALAALKKSLLHQAFTGQLGERAA